jgi:hypothetical protein
MAWCVGNAKEEKGRQSVMINKYAAGSAKIDPLMAGFNATKLLENNPVAGRAGCRMTTGRGQPPREHSQLHAALADGAAGVGADRRYDATLGRARRPMTTCSALSAAYACTRLIAGTYASLPVTVTSRGGDDDIRVPAKRAPLGLRLAARQPERRGDVLRLLRARRRVARAQGQHAGAEGSHRRPGDVAAADVWDETRVYRAQDGSDRI